jgi:hypothetical protein
MARQSVLPNAATFKTLAVAGRNIDPVLIAGARPNASQNAPIPALSAARSCCSDAAQKVSRTVMDY